MRLYRLPKYNKRLIWVTRILAFIFIVAICFGCMRLHQIKKENKEKYYSGIIDSLNCYLPGIICWGDSLTIGSGGGGINYPATIQQLLQEKLLAGFQGNVPVPEVLNMGVGGEDTNTILGRNGAVPFIVSADFVIPSDITPVNIEFQSSNGKAVAPLRQGKTGIEWVRINGISGTIDIEQEDYISDEYTYTFTRSVCGESVEVASGTPIITSGSTVGTDYLTVIFIGENGGYDTYEELINQQHAIINYQTANNDRFIIVGLHTGTASERAGLEKAMVDEYGDKYINLREYMAAQGLTDAGVECTDEDQEMIAEGMTPASLMIDDKCHFNSDGYRLIGNLIYNRMDELGYFDEVKEAINSKPERWQNYEDGRTEQKIQF